ncbi:hypothetical protein [Nocardioides bizhenqiangii]|uniref:DUF222 domain-containing protein n=1 Tax=Nocardioides bizhenqiangii TaxID=3095076 RepID=A0ABZ0ZR64_9ACTN|nr:hypothetical protein [Nocardioides sp. HM61]WQQ26815.1 hypothetical protein SHK19_00950 [Nocardioides sp. HM61]
MEARILRNEPIVLVASDAGFSVAAVNRHRRAHLRPELRAQLATRAPAHIADFADQLAELADDANSVRDFARESDNPDLLLRASASKRDTILTLIHHLGVDSTETVESLREAIALAAACVRVLPSHPDVVTQVVADLRTQGQDRLADELASAVGNVRGLPGIQANRALKEASR